MVSHPADLLESIASAPVTARPGIFRASLDGAWSFINPSGGVLMSVALGAMQKVIATSGEPKRVISATATFCSAVAEGPLEVTVMSLRAGKSAHQMRAHVRPMAGGLSDIGLEVTATFADASASPMGEAYVPFTTMPSDVPGPDESLRYEAKAPPAFYRNLDVRNAHGDVWWTADWKQGPARTARWFRYLVPPRGEDGAIDPLAIPPIADTMASAVHQALGPQKTMLLLPSLDLTIHFVSPMASDPAGWFLVDSRGHAAFGGQASARAEVWDEKGRLVALATQTMTIRGRRVVERMA